MTRRMIPMDSRPQTFADASDPPPSPPSCSVDDRPGCFHHGVTDNKVQCYKIEDQRWFNNGSQEDCISVSGSPPSCSVNQRKWALPDLFYQHSTCRKVRYILNVESIVVLTIVPRMSAQLFRSYSTTTWTAIRRPPSSETITDIFSPRSRKMHD